jgi:hypothetical protein
MAKGMVRVYDSDTKKVTMIPLRELSDAMVAVRIPGIG